MKITLITLLLACAGCASFTPEPIPTVATMQTIPYQQIGLRVAIPDWSSITITESSKYWLFYAFPLVKNPVSSSQFIVKISIEKTTLPSMHEQVGTSFAEWQSANHKVIDQRSNQFCTIIVKDIKDNQTVFRIKGTILHPSAWKGLELNPSAQKRLEHTVEQIVNSIAVPP